MTATHFQGPVVTGGLPENPEAGPNTSYQGDALMDPRFVYQPGITGLASIAGILRLTVVTGAVGVPAAKSNSFVATSPAAATAIAAAGQALPLRTTSGAGRAIGVPLVPAGQIMSAANAVSVMALDGGHTVGTSTAANATLASVGDTRILPLGGYLLVAGAGGSGAHLIGRMIAKTLTTVTLDRPVPAAVTAAPLFLMDTSGVSVVAHVGAGATRVFDAYSGISRGLVVLGGTGDGGYEVTVKGYDVWGVPMTETIVSTAGSSVSGVKAFKYIESAGIARGTGGATLTTSITVGTSDVFGFPLRAEQWEQVTAYWDGALVTAATGFVAPLGAGTTSTATTADVRGTYLTQSAADGIKRLTLRVALTPRQVLGATPADPAPMFGPPQA